MSNEILVEVDGVSKKFCRTLRRSLWYGMKDVTGELLGRRGDRNTLRKNEFWALENVSFELKRGECLGLIGPNGAGKSTLLKILNGLIKPDSGNVRIRGRVGALIELGAGFNPILTAKENIYINGSVLGLSNKEIKQKFDAIVEFAEIEDFVNTPVQNFSSGMKVRLGFAIAAQTEPDVLLIDEVLAVGDIGFRMKCFNAIRKMSLNSAIIFVSHQMPEIARSSTSALLIANNHQVLHSSDVTKVIEKYFELFNKNAPTDLDSEFAKIINVRVLDKNGIESTTTKYMDDCIVEIEVEIDKEIPSPSIGVSFVNPNMQLVLQCHSSFDHAKFKNYGGKSKVRLILPKLPLSAGAYSINVTIDGPNLTQMLARRLDACHVQVIGDFVGFAPVIVPGNWDFNPSTPLTQ